MTLPRSATSVAPGADSRSALAAALAYAARGWQVFPCKPGSKEPAVPHGFKDASTDPAQIRYWWSRRPTLNVAIRTGTPAGPDILDVDVRADGSGWPAFERLRAAGLLTGVRMLVRTPSGGLHAYFEGTAQGCGSLRRSQIDFKSAGGYVVAPPSTVGGRAYELLDERAPTGRALDWSACCRLLQLPRALPAQRSYPGGRDVGQLAKWLATQREGRRNASLYWAACRAVESGLAEHLGTLVAAAVSAGLDEPEARRTAASAAQRAGGAPCRRST